MDTEWEHYPWAWLFFVPFIVVTSFAVLNLFIGIIVDAMQTVQSQEKSENATDKITSTDLQQQLTRLQQSIDQLSATIAAKEIGTQR